MHITKPNSLGMNKTSKQKGKITKGGIRKGNLLIYTLRSPIKISNMEVIILRKTWCRPVQALYILL